MPISGHTLEKLRKFTALVCCPSCGKRSEHMESLTSCGHYLCAKCVNQFVLSSGNKCPKCYAINSRNDCREDVFLNSVSKIGHKLNKLVDKQSSNKSESKPQSKQLETKQKETPKKVKTQKDLKACIAKETKSKPKNSSSSTSSLTDNKVEDKGKQKKTKMAANQKSTALLEDDDIISIPDSFDNELFTQTSRSNDNEMVSMVLEGLESNCDELTLNTTAEDGSGDQTKSMNGSSLLMIEEKSCQKSKQLAHIGVQTIEKPRVILQNASVQCTVPQIHHSVQTTPPQTSAVVNNESSDCCQSNNCCFHKFVETIPCNSLKSFLKSLIQLKNSPPEEELTIVDTIPPNTSVLNKTNEMPSLVKNVETEPPKVEEPMSSFDLFDTNSTIDSVPSSIPSEVMTSEVKKQNKPKARRESSEDNTSVKKRSASAQPKNKTKKLKSVESNDEEMKVIEEPEPKPQEPVISKDIPNLTVIEINSSDGTSQSNSTVDETSKAKPRIKGPKSRQNVGNKTITETVSEEPKNRSKRPKTYVSSDESEVEEIPEKQEIEVNKILTETKNKNKGNRKTAQNKKTVEKRPVLDTTTEDTITEKEDIPRRQTTKRMPSKAVPKPKGAKKNLDQLAKDLAEQSNTENVFLVTEDEKTIDESVVTNQRTKRKAIPKKRFPIEDSESDQKEVEEKANNSKKRQLNEDIPKELAKNTKYKPKPKSKQKQVIPVKESDDEMVFKRPPRMSSPTPSTISSTSSSSSSRQRTSSTERSNQKRVILFSGLDDKQKRKVENVCRELDAEPVSEWSDRVTHLVIALADDRPKKDMICPRNAKYIKALLKNIWIVTYDWIVDSSRSDRFIDESNYEIKGDKSATERGLPHISRTGGQKLFHKRMVKFDGKFGNLLSEFKEFVEIGGGIVVLSEDEFDEKKSEKWAEKLIIVTEAVGLPNTQKDGTKYISKKAFMESISNFTPI